MPTRMAHPYAHNLRNRITRINYNDHATSDPDSDDNEDDPVAIQVGVLPSSADPRYVGRSDDATKGDVCLTMNEVRQLLQPEQAHQVGLGKV